MKITFESNGFCWVQRFCCWVLSWFLGFTAGFLVGSCRIHRFYCWVPCHIHKFYCWVPGGFWLVPAGFWLVPVLVIMLEKSLF